MKVEIFNSGSSGNCASIDGTLIIDAGFDCEPDGSYVFLTHNHTDHTKHLGKFSGLPVYALPETAERLIRTKYPYIAFSELSPYEQVFVKDYQYIIQPILLKHDVPCVGFDITRSDYVRILWATDFNAFVDEDSIIQSLKDKVYDHIYIECNNTLSPIDMLRLDYPEDEKEPKEAFHMTRSFRNHCNADYLIGLFTRAGYSEHNRFTEPVTLLHKSTYYYQSNVNRIGKLMKIINVTNPFLL